MPRKCYRFHYVVAFLQNCSIWQIWCSFAVLLLDKLKPGRARAVCRVEKGGQRYKERSTQKYMERCAQKYKFLRDRTAITAENIREKCNKLRSKDVGKKVEERGRGI